MNAFVVAGSSPLDHVLDHNFGWSFGITNHVLFMLIAATVCVVGITLIARSMAGGIDRWAEEIETLSDNEIDVQIFGASSLVGARENIVAVAKGDIECAFSVQFQWGKTLPIMTVTTAPYAFSDLEIWRNWHDSEAAAFLGDKLLEKGVKNVVWLFQTNSAVFTSKGKPLVKPEDFRGLKIMQDTGCPVIFDATHSVQLPGGEGKRSGGQREFAPVLARAAVAAGADGLFLEVHKAPDQARCDGPNSLKLESLYELFKQFKALRNVIQT